MRCWSLEGTQSLSSPSGSKSDTSTLKVSNSNLKVLWFFHCFLDSETQFLSLTKEWCPHFLFSEEIKWNKLCEAHSNYWFNLYQIRSFGISTQSLDWITDELTCRSQVSDLKNAEQKQKSSVYNRSLKFRQCTGGLEQKFTRNSDPQVKCFTLWNSKKTMI